MPELTPEEIETYRRTWRAREQAHREQIEARRQRGWELARKAAVLLKEEFGASRVVVFGSLLHPRRFHARSDIDLAVWDVQRYLTALGRLLDLDPDFEFDLVPIEDAKPHIAQAIHEEGIDL